MMAREFQVVGERGYFGDPGDHGVSQTAERRTQSDKAVLDELAERASEPACAVQRPFDRPAPRTGDETRVAPNTAARACRTIEVERVGDREADKITNGLAEC